MNDAPDFVVHWPDTPGESGSEAAVVDAPEPNPSRPGVDDDWSTDAAATSQPAESPRRDILADRSDDDYQEPEAGIAPSPHASTGKQPERPIGRLRLRLSTAGTVRTPGGAGSDAPPADQVAQLRRRLAEVEAELRREQALGPGRSTD